jgi:Zn-dependent protease
MDRTTKRALWIVAGVVVFIALLLHHNINSDEVIFFVVVVPSIILHEVSHGWVARAFGDDTAARAGRLTLNPLVHVDPVGTLIVPAVMALAGVGVFGWPSPYPSTPSGSGARAIRASWCRWPDQ